MHPAILLPLLICMTISAVSTRNVGLEGDLYEGDIALRTSLPSNSTSTVKLAAIRDASKIWPGGKIPFRIDTDSIPSEEHRRLILGVMESLSHAVSCIQFQENEDVQKFDYVRIAGDGDKFHSSSGCWSYVGLQGGEQTLNLGSGCFTEELILHEFLHLLGIIHEQNRPDRDDFVEISWSNIQSGMAGQFEKRNESDVNMQDTPYDFRSRMHYTGNSFSKSDIPTIIARYPGNDNFGPLDKLSPTDIVEISLLYGCDIESRTLVKYTHANRYANEVRIEQVWDEMEAVNSTIEDKFCQIDDKLEEMDTKLRSKSDQKNACNELEIKVDKTDAQIQLIKDLFATKNNLIDKQFELSDYKSTALEEKIEMKTNETLIKVELIKEIFATKNDLTYKHLELTDFKATALEEKIKEIDSDHESKLVKTNELFTSKNDKMERQINELFELFNSRNTEIEQLKEKTNALEEENKKINKLNNQQKGIISKMEEKLVNVNGILTMNQLDIEKHDKVTTEYEQNLTELGKVSTDNKQKIDEILIWLQVMTSIQLPKSTLGVECSGSKTVIYPGNIFSPNHPSNYPANVDCIFTLIPLPGKSVHLEFTAFNVHNTGEDYVEINPPINGVSQFYKETLSDAPPTTTFDVDQQVTVRFVTRPTVDTHPGWNAKFNIV